NNNIPPEPKRAEKLKRRLESLRQHVYHHLINNIEIVDEKPVVTESDDEELEQRIVGYQQQVDAIAKRIAMYRKLNPQSMQNTLLRQEKYIKEVQQLKKS